jgi:hypothetical protein
MLPSPFGVVLTRTASAVQVSVVPRSLLVWAATVTSVVDV